MSVQVRDRRFKPRQWRVRRERVDPSCRWSWNGLILGWPLWEGGFNTTSAGVDPEREIRDVVNKHHGDLVGFATPAIDFVGSRRGMVAQAVTVSANIRSIDGSAWLPTAAGSVVLHYRKTDTTNRAAQAFGLLGVANASLFDCHLPFSDGVVYWDFGNAGFGAPNRLSVAGLTFGDDVWVFSNGTSGMQIWQNGILRASGSAATRTASTTEPFCLFRGNFQQADLSECGACWIYDRQLSAAEVMRLTIDPYAPIRPMRRFAYGTSGGGGGGSGARSFVPAMIG